MMTLLATTASSWTFEQVSGGTWAYEYDKPAGEAETAARACAGDWSWNGFLAVSCSSPLHLHLRDYARARALPRSARSGAGAATCPVPSAVGHRNPIQPHGSTRAGRRDGLANQHTPRPRCKEQTSPGCRLRTSPDDDDLYRCTPCRPPVHLLGQPPLPRPAARHVHARHVVHVPLPLAGGRAASAAPGGRHAPKTNTGAACGRGSVGNPPRARASGDGTGNNTRGRTGTGTCRLRRVPPRLLSSPPPIKRAPSAPRNHSSPIAIRTCLAPIRFRPLLAVAPPHPLPPKSRGATPPARFGVQRTDEMAQRDMKEEPTELRAPEITLCANNCGFPGNPATQNLCQGCFLAVTASVPSSPSSPTSSSSATSQPRPAVVDQQQQPAAAAPAAAVDQPRQVPEVKAARTSTVNRCSSCRKRVGLTGFRCRCGELFCGQHRYSDRHGCGFDYKGAARDAIARENPVVRAAKVVRF